MSLPGRKNRVYLLEYIAPLQICRTLKLLFYSKCISLQVRVMELERQLSRLRALAAIPEDWSSVSSSHIVQFLMACNSSPGGFEASDLLRHLHSCARSHMQILRHTHTTKI